MSANEHGNQRHLFVLINKEHFFVDDNVVSWKNLTNQNLFTFLILNKKNFQHVIKFYLTDILCISNAPPVN